MVRHERTVDEERRHWQQTVTSVLTTATVLGINLNFGWATRAALFPTIWLLLAYNLFDTAVGLRRYMTREPVYLVHHACSVGGALVALRILYFGDARTVVHLERVTRWLLLAEVTTLFNGVRLLARHTMLQRATEIAFGGIFLVGRSAMTLGCLAELRGNASFAAIAPFCGIFNALNLYWGVQITRKMRGRPVRDPRVPFWLEVARLLPPTMLPLAALHAESHGRTLTAASAWLACAGLTWGLWRPSL